MPLHLLLLAQTDDQIDAIAPLIILAVMALVGLVIFFLVARYEKGRTGGMYFWQRRALYKRGAVAHGKVLDQFEVSSHMAGRILFKVVDLAIEVSAEGAAPFRVSLRYDLPWTDRDRVSTGAFVPLRCDPRDPRRVVIDWPAIRAEKSAKDSAAHEAARARHEAVMRGEGGGGG